MSGCDDCDNQNLIYGYNYLKYGSNFPYYLDCNTIPNKYIGRNRCCEGPYVKLNNQKQIWNTVRVPASEYIMNKSALNVYSGTKSWNSQSDRLRPSNTTLCVPSRGNSTKYSITRMRPGACSAPGKGVDIKHNSYDRYLAKLKGRGPLRTQKNSFESAKQGNKTKYYGIAYSNSCFC
jgi:hypothetical protein